jgi:peptidoglycan-N-acetylglucosamine deacetylase
MTMLIIILSVIIGYYIYGVFDIRKNIFIKSINSASENTICLTFDDGPDSESTPKILDMLNNNGIKGTFFLIGENVFSNPELVKRISDEGHAIGNHTYYHKTNFPFFCKRKMTEEIKKTNLLIEGITSTKVIYFRAPFGITNPNLKSVLKKLNLKSIGWDIRSLDTITPDPSKLYNKVIKGINRGGSIVLFHDRCTSTIEILENVITHCKNNNFQFKTISDIINEK